MQAMLGHASATLTLDRYAHLFGVDLDAVADRLDAARVLHVPCVRHDDPVVDLAERRASR
ncbi:MAG: hypothetical protein M3P96_01165 [Actinomycetota bacterium]|nr:hypothetical protein [Actinomycetota bacterium]